ncbi:1571_t:CDS:2, partial [Entrophospora sp. SA101]
MFKKTIIGMILSDGSLEQMGKHARLRIEQKDQRALIWIREVVKPLFAYAIATFTLPYFTELRKECRRCPAASVMHLNLF